MRVKTNNEIRTVDEMYDMFAWCIGQFDKPGKRWIYGKDSVDFTGGIFISGPFDIEWIEFTDDKDATVFMLRWS